MYKSDLVQNTETMQRCNLLEPGVTAQAMSHQFLTTKAWVHSQGYGISNKVVLGGSSPSTAVFSYQF
jgi:hypothetical protein